MNRLQFLKKLVLGTTAIAVAPKILAETNAKPLAPENDTIKYLFTTRTKPWPATRSIIVNKTSNLIEIDGGIIDVISTNGIPEGFMIHLAFSDNTILTTRQNICLHTQSGFLGETGSWIQLMLIEQDGLKKWVEISRYHKLNT